MGRTQRLRQERRRQESASTSTSTSTTTTTTTTTTATATATATATTSVVGTEATTTTSYTNANSNANDDVSSTSTAGTGALSTAAATITWHKLTHPNLQFPISDFYIQALQLTQEKNNQHMKAIIDLFVRGAIEDGCINSMNGISLYHLDPVLNQDRVQKIFLAHPWSLEGALRGSVESISELLNRIYSEAKPCAPLALQKYWMKMMYKCYEWNGDYSIAAEKKSKWKVSRDAINSRCFVCGQEDTDTLTLKQCMGCSTFCYCNTECQTLDWALRGHYYECKQIQILNKYHKPYAKEIHDAAIRGESHPALEKLRNKLGLSRPTKEYVHLLLDLDTGTGGDGRPIDPCKFIIARKDGTVWIGSTPNPIRSPSSDN